MSGQDSVLSVSQNTNTVRNDFTHGSAYTTRSTMSVIIQNPYFYRVALC